jgi:hypothetical protein
LVERGKSPEGHAQASLPREERTAQLAVGWLIVAIVRTATVGSGVGIRHEPELFTAIINIKLLVII